MATLSRTPSPDRLVALAWAIASAGSLHVRHDGELPEWLLGCYGFYRRRAVGLVSLNQRLQANPLAEAEVLLHELGHHHNPTLLGDIAACTAWQYATALSRSELYACRWARDRAIPLDELAAVASDLANSFDVADHFGTTHGFALQAIDLYRHQYAGSQTLDPSVRALFARVEQEGA